MEIKFNDLYFWRTSRKVCTLFQIIINLMSRPQSSSFGKKIEQSAIGTTTKYNNCESDTISFFYFEISSLTFLQYKKWFVFNKIWGKSPYYHSPFEDNHTTHIHMVLMDIPKMQGNQAEHLAYDQ
jgi:hypothetical protein